MCVSRSIFLFFVRFFSVLKPDLLFFKSCFLCVSICYLCVCPICMHIYVCRSVFDFDQWSSHDEVGRIEYPLSLARQATQAFQDIEDDLVMHIALILSKHGEVEVEENMMASPFESQERGGGIVDICLTVFYCNISLTIYKCHYIISFVCPF
jgi:hypothetical protein